MNWQMIAILMKFLDQKKTRMRLKAMFWRHESSLDFLFRIPENEDFSSDHSVHS